MFDVLIIGGGIAGVSAAARLAAFGSVILLERETALATQASGRSAALFEQNYGSPSTKALNQASRADHEARGVLSPRGFLLVAKAGDDGFEAERREMGLDEISLDEARGMWPILAPDVTRAAYHADCYDIDTDALVQSFAREARDQGAEIVTGSAPTALRRTARGWAVETSHGPFEARQIVNAAGAWADEVAQLAGIAPMGITPYRRSMARIAAPVPADAPMLFGPGETWYAKPDAGALIVSPADEDAMPPHDAWADDMVLAEGLARYEAHVTAPVERMIANWAGLRSFAPDRNLVLGPDPLDRSFVWCAGQGGYGMQSAPGASRHLAAVLAGTAPEIDAEAASLLDPGRFR